MGVIINPRGTNGAGKTELVRRLLGGLALEPIFRPGRARPIACRALAGTAAAFVVIGHYERRCGGCDTVPLHDGGLDEIVRLADLHAAEGMPVLLEGALLSEDVARTAGLAERHEMQVLCLDTKLDVCVRNLVARRRLGAAAAGRIAGAVAARQAAIVAACQALDAAGAHVRTLPFDSALTVARRYLDLPGALPLDPAGDGRPQTRTTLS